MCQNLDVMFQFKPIEYLRALQFFDQAEELGIRLRMGEFETSKWLQRENIKLDEIVAFSKQMPDAKNFIIGSGVNQGFYIYSQKLQLCFKSERQLEAV